MYGKSSAPASGSRISRDRGPQIPRQASCDVTSSTRTDPSSGAWEWIQARSWRPNAVPVTIRNRFSARRVTVKSHSIPPRSFSIDVYVIAPTSRATLLSQSRSRKSAAPAGHLDFREGRLVEDRGRLARRTMFRADRRRPEASRPAAWTERFVARGCVRLEPVRALPAGLLAESRPELGEPRIGGGEAERPPGRALVAGVLDVVV